MPHKDPEARRAYDAGRREHNAAQARARRATDGGRSTAQQAARRAADPERRRRQVLAAYYKDPEAARAKRKAHYHANLERHREVARLAHARRMERDPEQYRAWIRARWARERNAEGSCTAQEWQAVLAIYGERCLRCGAVEDITQDHVIPLILGGTHWPWNLQPLCRSCNSAKAARNTDDYRPDAGAAVRALMLEEGASA